MSTPDLGKLEAEAVYREIALGNGSSWPGAIAFFEEAVANRAGRKYGVAVSSGTAGLHLSLLAAGVRPGDKVICPTLTFVATANVIRYVGASPIFVDCDVDTGNLSPQLLSAAFSNSVGDDQRVGAVIAVDMFGKVANFDEITGIASKYDVPVVSDAAESLGASRQGKPAGSFGLGAVFSFNTNKVVTTGGGGAVVTDSAAFAGRVRFLSNQAKDAAPHFQHSEQGFNYRMSGLSAALGRVQLQRLDEMIARRRQVRQAYKELFADVSGWSVFGQPDQEDNAWLTVVRVDSRVSPFSAAELREHLDRNEIESRPVWKPMHLQPLFRGSPAILDGSSEDLFKNGLALPSGSAMQTAELSRVKQTILNLLDSKVR